MLIETEALQALRLTGLQEAVLAQFGLVPDFSQPDLQRLAIQVSTMPFATVRAFAADRDVALTDDAGAPVPHWLALATVLYAREAGLLTGA